MDTAAPSRVERPVVNPPPAVMANRRERNRGGAEGRSWNLPAQAGKVALEAQLREAPGEAPTLLVDPPGSDLNVNQLLQAIRMLNEVGVHVSFLSRAPKGSESMSVNGRRPPIGRERRDLLSACAATVLACALVLHPTSAPAAAPGRRLDRPAGGLLPAGCTGAGGEDTAQRLGQHAPWLPRAGDRAGCEGPSRMLRVSLRPTAVIIDSSTAAGRTGRDVSSPIGR